MKKTIEIDAPKVQGDKGYVIRIDAYYCPDCGCQVLPAYNTLTKKIILYFNCHC